MKLGITEIEFEDERVKKFSPCLLRVVPDEVAAYLEELLAEDSRKAKGKAPWEYVTIRLQAN